MPRGGGIVKTKTPRGGGATLKTNPTRRRAVQDIKPPVPASAFSYPNGACSSGSKRQRDEDVNDDEEALKKEVASFANAAAESDEADSDYSDDDGADTGESRKAKRRQLESSEGGSGGWKHRAKKRIAGSVGKDGGPETFSCKVCLTALPPAFFNAKKLNGVRRGWTPEEDLACKTCNLVRAQMALCPQFKLGGPLARAKSKEKAHLLKVRK